MEESFDLAFSKADFSAGHRPLALDKHTSLRDKKKLLEKAKKIEAFASKDKESLVNLKLEQAAKRAAGEKDLTSVKMLKKQIKKTEKRHGGGKDAVANETGPTNGSVSSTSANGSSHGPASKPHRKAGF
jgi:hypothetical protein